MCVNSVDLEMEVDSRCDILCDRGKPAIRVGLPLVLQQWSLKLGTLTGEVIILKGKAEGKVEYGGQPAVSFCWLHLESDQR